MIARSTRLAVALTIPLVLALTPAPNASGQTPRIFSTQPLDLGAGSHRMYDLGVVDYNGDGKLDLFSTNHTTRMSLRPGDGTLNYPLDAVPDVGLDSDPALPGVEQVGPPVDMSAPGLYIYRSAEGKLVASAVIGSDVTSVDATLTVLGGAHATPPTGGVTATVTAGTDGEGRPTNSVHITAASSGSDTIGVELTAVTLDVHVVSPTSASEVHLGVPAINPPGLDFSWFLHDRHGVSWTDVNGDGVLDMTLANGGLKGQISTYPGVSADELLLGGTGGFSPAPPAELIANHCRSRAMHWVDVNDDGLLDLFITCELQPSRLLLRNADGSLTEASDELPPIADAVPFLWIDLDGDHVPELIVPTSTGLGVYARSSTGQYVRQKRIGPAQTYTDLALADINHDGYPDIYAASTTASSLLLGTGSGFRAIAPTHYGLPATAERASWVDVDNDGRADLFTVPGGIYLQRKTGHFAASGLLADVFPATAVKPLYAWFDGDGDGDRDLVTRYELAGSYDGYVSMTTNEYARGHWLDLDLVGPSGNLSAIGATATITAGGLTTTHWVGESEDSVSSQGHYRIYVGLGAATSTDSITITWPDGTTQSVPNAGNQRVVVQYQPV